MLEGKKILIGITGGIAAYKICYLVRMLVREKANVRVVMTPSAAKFVSPVTLSTLSKNEVHINLFPDSSDYKKIKKVTTKTLHVELGLWADIMIISPATLNTISKVVSGICDNLLLTTLYSARCPVVFAPAMDDDMSKHIVTKKNFNKLEKLGYKIIDPEEGVLASGLTGLGRMAEPETIFDYIKNFFQSRSDLSGKKILITAGPTVEHLDPVRYITNPSTGKMGYEIARAAKKRGAEVTLISGPVNLKKIDGVKTVFVKTADEMFKAVKKNLEDTGLIVMSAAVEDLKPVSISRNKIKKSGKGKRFNIEFELATDILKYLGENKKQFRLIGFALETDNDISNAKKKLREKNADMIVLNNASVKGAGFGTDTNIVTFVKKDKVTKLKKMIKFEVGNKILDEYLKMLK